MGCGSSRTDAGSTAQVSKLHPHGSTPTQESGPSEETWATKSEMPKAMGSLAAADSAKRHSAQSNLVIVSDEGDDSIEAMVAELEDSSIIGSQQADGMTSVMPAPPVSVARPATARGSGAVATDTLGPLAEDSPTVQPLPRQQLEEAGKLAEARRRFDNQRYHHSSSKGGSMSSLHVHVGDPFPAAPPGATTPTPVLHSHSGSKLVGLSLNGGSSCLQPEVDLPGGVWEELEQPVPKKTESRWSRGSKHFDADDEALMAEIVDEAE